MLSEKPLFTNGFGCVVGDVYAWEASPTTWGTARPMMPCGRCGILTQAGRVGGGTARAQVTSGNPLMSDSGECSERAVSHVRARGAWGARAGRLARRDCRLPAPHVARPQVAVNRCAARRGRGTFISPNSWRPSPVNMNRALPAPVRPRAPRPDLLCAGRCHRIPIQPELDTYNIPGSGKQGALF